MLIGTVVDQPSAAKLNSLSIIIPVYNQEQKISASLYRIKRILDSTLMTFEIIVVNDGSLDNTLDVLRKEESADPRIRIITYTPNRGKGFAVKLGVLESKGDIVIFTDGDLDISPEAIKEYVKKLDESDLVIASKAHPLSKVNAPLSRKILSRAFNLLTRMIVGIKIKDTQSGLKAGNGEALREIFRVMLVKRYAFDVEMLAIATHLKFRIKEMPIEITIDRRFKVKDIVRMLIDIMAISYRLRITGWYQQRLDIR